MLTREEFITVQQHLVELVDKRDMMRKEIAQMSNVRQECAAIKQQIAEYKDTSIREERRLIEEMERVQAKITQITDELRVDTNRNRTWDEKRLLRLEQNLKEVIQESVTYTDQVKSLQNRRALLKAKEGEIDAHITDTESVIAKYNAVKDRIGSFSAINLKMTELESEIARLGRERKRTQQRIRSDENAIERLTKINSGLESDLEEKNQQLNSASSSKVSSEQDGETAEDELRGERTRLKLVNSELSDWQIDLEREQKVSNERVSEAGQARDDLAEELVDVEATVAQLSQSIRNYKIEHDIVVNKKTSLIDQLQKSIKDKVHDIIRSRNNSPYVLRLVASQEKHWMQRQQMYEEYCATEVLHKKKTDLVARKATIVNEMREWIKALPETSETDPIAILNVAFNAACSENKTLANNLAQVKNELRVLQEE